jgi:hypothetical protein
MSAVSTALFAALFSAPKVFSHTGTQMRICPSEFMRKNVEAMRLIRTFWN